MFGEHKYFAWGSLLVKKNVGGCMGEWILICRWKCNLKAGVQGGICAISVPSCTPRVLGNLTLFILYIVFSLHETHCSTVTYHLKWGQMLWTLLLIILSETNLMYSFHGCSAPYSSKTVKNNIYIIFLWLFNAELLFKFIRVHCKGLRNFSHYNMQKEKINVTVLSSSI